MSEAEQTPKAEDEAHPYRVGAEPNVNLIVSTSNDLVGLRIIRYLGVVRGIVVRTPSFGKSLVGAFKSLRGGNIREYVDVCEQARHEAYSQMVEHALELGADAIVAMRYDATEFGQGATEVLAYGTAVQTGPA